MIEMDAAEAAARARAAADAGGRDGVGGRRGGAEAPATRRALRRIRLAVATIFLVNGTAIGVWAAHIPLLKEAHHLSERRLGLVLLGFALGAMATMVTAGWMTARWGSGRVTLMAAFAFCAGLPLPALAPNAGLLFASALLVGACNGAMDVAMNAHATLLERAWRAPIMSSFHAFFSLGGLLGAALSSLFIVRGFTAGVTMPLAGVALGLVALLTARTLWRELPAPAPAPRQARASASEISLTVHTPGAREVPRQRAAAAMSSSTSDATRDASRSPAAPTLALPSRGLVRLGAIGFCAAIAEGAMVDWTGVYLSTVLGAAAAFAAAGYAACSLSMTLGRLGGDAIVARLGRRRTLTGSGLLAACSLALAVLAGAPWLAALGFGLAGFGLANIIPIVYADAGNTHPDAPGVGVATVATMGYAGFLLGPPLIGFTASLVGLRLALGLLVAATAIISLLGLRHASPARLTHSSGVTEPTQP